MRTNRTRIRPTLGGLAFLALTCLLPADARAQTERPAAVPVAERASQSRAKGRAGAPVLVFEIADFQCPYCARFAREVYPRLEEEYIETGKVQWVFVNLPLPNHPHAWLAAEAATCAGAAGDRFWPVHDRLFEKQSEWGNAPDPAAVLARYAREAGVSMKAWEACVAGDLTAALLLQDAIFASSSGVQGTPAFIVNRQEMVVGLKSYEEWKDILEKALQKK